MLEGKNGVKIKENRVFIASETVEQILGPFPKKTKDDQSESSFHISGYALRCYDFRTGEIKNQQ